MKITPFFLTLRLQIIKPVCRQGDFPVFRQHLFFHLLSCNQITTPFRYFCAQKDEKLLQKAIRMDVMLHAYMFMQSGIPVLYSGDEIGQLNDYTYKEDCNKAADSRYIHRGAMNWQDAAKTDDDKSVQGQIFASLDKLEKIRQSEKVFVSYADTWTIETGDKAVLAIGRYYDNRHAA